MDSAEDKRMRTSSGSENIASQASPRQMFSTDVSMFEYAYTSNNFDNQLVSVTSGKTVETTADEDVFQCGKCKQRFYQLEHFFNHKGQCKMSVCTLIDNNEHLTTSTSTSFATMSENQPQQQDVSSSLSALLASNVVESDLLSLASSFDASAMLSLSNSISPSSLLHLHTSGSDDDFGSFHQLGTSADRHHHPSSIVEQSQSSQQQQTSQGSHHSVLFTTIDHLPSSSSTGTVMNVDAFYDMIIGSSNDSSVLLKSSFDPTLASVGVLDTDSRSSNLLASPSDYFTNLVASSASTDVVSDGNAQAARGLLEKAPSIMVEHRPQSTNASGSTNYEMLTIAPDMMFQIMDQHAQNIDVAPSHTPATTSSSITPLQPVSAVSSAFFNQTKSEGSEADVTSNNEKPENETDEDKNKEGKLHQCHDCNRAFTKHSDYVNHKSYHTGQRPYLCTVCGKALSCRPNLNKHVKAHSLPADQEADVVRQCLVFCDLKIKERNTLMKKMANESELSLVESNLKIHSVEPQQDGTPSLAQVDQHTNVLKCSHDECPTRITNVDDYIKHIRLHDRQKSLADNLDKTNKTLEQTCSLLLAPTTTLDSQESKQTLSTVLVVHKPAEEIPELVEQTMTMATATADNETKLKQESQLSAVIQLETTEPIVKKKSNKKRQPKFFRCNVCLSRYSSEEALHNHQSSTTHHFECEHCTKVFPCERYLRRHLMTHGEDVYSCRYCDKAFKTANYLKVHVVIHTGEKPFACTTCAARFNRRDKLKRHLLTHDPVKKYKCPFADCTRAFNRPDKFKAHLVTHSGVKPYSCTQCDRCFTRPAHLREHYKTHPSHPSYSGRKDIRQSTVINNLGSIPVTISTKQGCVPYVPKKAEDLCLIKEPAELVNLVSKKGPKDMSDISLLSMVEGEKMANYVLLYPCNKCQQYFLSEIDLKNHACRKKKTTTININNSGDKKISPTTSGTSSAVVSCLDQEMMPPPPPPV